MDLSWASWGRERTARGSGAHSRRTELERSGAVPGRDVGASRVAEAEAEAGPGWAAHHRSNSSP